MSDVSWFITKKLLKTKTTLSTAFIRIAIIAVAISIIIMLLSVSVLEGFKAQVREKLSLFSGHIVIIKQEMNYSYEKSPIYKDYNLINQIKKIPEIKHIQCFAIKPGLIRTKKTMQGVVIKGIDKDFDWNSFEKNLIIGHKIHTDSIKPSKEVIISQKLANLLELDTADNLYMYFFGNPPKLRKYKIVGIYSTGTPEIDKTYILADIHDVQKLNEWNYKDNPQITGYEVILHNYKDIPKVYPIIYQKFGIKFDKDGNKLNILTINDLYPSIVSWLALLDLNALVMIIIIITIASINMITALLILILERSRLIGILKALGSTNFSIQKIFIFNGLYILIKGLIWGNFLGLLLIILQKNFHLIKLNPDLYYSSYIPLKLTYGYFGLLNIGVVILTLLILSITSLIISKIQPVKVIKFN